MKDWSDLVAGSNRGCPDLPSHWKLTILAAGTNRNWLFVGFY